MLRASAFVVVFGSAAACFAVDTVEVAGVVDRVTVYRGQALVTRAVEAPGPAGLREVIVTGLPDRIVPESLYAETTEGGEVRSVRYRERPVEQDVREDVRKLDAELLAVNDQLESVTQRLKLIGEHKVYLGNLETFASSSATIELKNGVLNSDTLKSLTLFMLEQRRAVTDEELSLRISDRELRDKIGVLQRQRQALTAGSARTHREAVVLLSLAADSGARVLLHYLVNDANWEPSYNARANDEIEVVIEYQASVRQMSGENWTDVAMTLSTATPSLVAKAPQLTPLAVRLTAAQVQQLAQSAGPEEMAQTQKRMRARQGELADARNAGVAQRQGKNQDLDRELNELASQMQFYDLLTRQDLGRRESELKAAESEGLCVTYDLPSRTSLPSRADQQLVQIAKLPMKGDFYRVATPVLTGYVYRETEVINSSPVVLLAGPLSTYVGGQFVGHGAIPTVTTGERFTVGLGIDSSLRASRELINRFETHQGGNRNVEFTYRLAIENFGQPAAVRLIDRIPTGKDHEIKVTFVGSTEPIVEPSGDRTKNNGMLRWDVAVPPGSVDAQASAVDYTFRLEYDKTMSIVGGVAMAAIGD